MDLTDNERDGQKMTSTVKSAGVYGIDGFEVDVECFASGNTPNFNIVGLPVCRLAEVLRRDFGYDILGD